MVTMVAKVALGLRAGRIATKRTERVVLLAADRDRAFVATVAVMQPSGLGLIRCHSVDGQAHKHSGEEVIHGVPFLP
jgi:hypothetical protein